MAGHFLTFFNSSFEFHFFRSREITIIPQEIRLALGIERVPTIFKTFVQFHLFCFHEIIIVLQEIRHALGVERVPTVFKTFVPFFLVKERAFPRNDVHP